MSFNSILLDPVLNPVLALPPFWGVLIISLIIAVIITFVYKWMTDQHLMKSLKDDIKKFQKEMKLFKKDPQKMMAMQKKAMETNMKYMMHSMKPTIIYLVPIILIFGWLNANLAFEPLFPDEEFNTTMVFRSGTTGSAELIVGDGITLTSDAIQNISCSTKKSFMFFSKEICKSEWSLKGDNGDHILEYSYQGNIFNKEILITTKQEYKPVSENIKEGALESINVKNNPLKTLNLLGWKIGWLGTYIIFSLIFSLSLRKWLKIH